MANIVPVGHGPTNDPDGYYFSLIEKTKERLMERRANMLNGLATATDRSPATAWPRVLATLETNPTDVPFALLYELTQIGDTTSLRLQGQIGLPDGHNLLVDGADINGSEGLAPDCRIAGPDIRLIDYDDRFASLDWHGFGVPSKQIAILPFSGHSRVYGYLVVGTNPYRPCNDEYMDFISQLRRMATSVICAAIYAQESDARTNQLEADLADTDMKLRHLIEHASVGMVHMTVDGEMLWANDQFYALHNLPSDQKMSKLNVFDAYSDDDRDKAEEAWASLTQGAGHVNYEVRMKSFYTSPLGDEENVHIQVLAFPYRERGQVKSIMASTIDISRLKWAQHFQARQAAEAREAKRQQEAFIDVVSHEMRNPLSAIVHCADEIAKSVEECRSKLGELPELCISTLEENVTAANIILQCANHQKRIIDDVLTLSRLDSMLLSFTPTPIQPLKLVNTIGGIFEAEVRAEHITYSAASDGSLSRLKVGQVYLDPSRVTQIFINLVTNAIKFVKDSRQPEITIRYGASVAHPRDFFPKNIHWADGTANVNDVTESPEWGSGEVVYLTFTVTDTGIGMSEEEIYNIFQRFHQANMRTHVKYGGTGLGLFISKELAERQGGEIGVVSVPGQGTTFGFYIKTKRVPNRPKHLTLLPKPADGAGAQKLYVLLVEDNLINQQVLVKQLKKAGCVVDVANHGQEALDILEGKSELFDVILMDMEMPVMDGLTAIHEIRRKQKEEQLAEHLPIIAVTANVRQEQIDTALAAGAVRITAYSLLYTTGANIQQDRVMRKPFKAIDLVHMMKELVPQVKTPSSEPSTPGLILPMGGMLL
jgi:signal transduction histidine kinase/CheY-like chemotaxis protein